MRCGIDLLFVIYLRALIVIYHNYHWWSLWIKWRTHYNLYYIFHEHVECIDRHWCHSYDLTFSFYYNIPIISSRKQMGNGGIWEVSFYVWELKIFIHAKICVAGHSITVYTVHSIHWHCSGWNGLKYRYILYYRQMDKT